jgi:hypothetical protein
MMPFLNSSLFWNSLAALMVVSLFLSGAWHRHRVFTLIQTIQLLEVPLLYFAGNEDWQIWHDLWKINVGLEWIAASSVAMKRWPWFLSAVLMVTHSCMKMAISWNHNADVQFAGDALLEWVRWINRVVIIAVIFATYTDHGDNLAEEIDDGRREAPSEAWTLRTD